MSTDSTDCILNSKRNQHTSMSVESVSAFKDTGSLYIIHTTAIGINIRVCQQKVYNILKILVALYYTHNSYRNQHTSMSAESVKQFKDTGSLYTKHTTAIGINIRICQQKVYNILKILVALYYTHSSYRIQHTSMSVESVQHFRNTGHKYTTICHSDLEQIDLRRGSDGSDN